MSLHTLNMDLNTQSCQIELWINQWILSVYSQNISLSENLLTEKWLLTFLQTKQFTVAESKVTFQSNGITAGRIRFSCHISFILCH